MNVTDINLIVSDFLQLYAPFVVVFGGVYFMFVICYRLFESAMGIGKIEQYYDK